MLSARVFLASVLLLVSSACQAKPEPIAPLAAPVSRGSLEHFTLPPHGLHVEADLALGELLARYTKLMGWGLEVSGPQRGVDEWRCDLVEPLDVPPERVHSFVEAMLRAHELFLEFAHGSSPVVLRVITPVSSTNSVREFVPAADVPLWADHPAHFIATELRVSGPEARQLASSLQYIFSSPDLVRITQLEKECVLVASGPGSDLANLVRIVGDLERAESLPAAPARSSSAAARLLELLATPASGLHLQSQAADGPSIEELTSEYARLMGWHLLIPPLVREKASATRTGISSPIEIPAGNVHAFVQGVLRSNGFVLRFAQTASPVVLELGDTFSVTSGPRPGLAPVVTPEELVSLADHPAFLVQTDIYLPGVDVVALSKALRGEAPGRSSVQLLPIASEHLLVAGHASDLVQMFPFFHALVANSAGKAMPLPDAPAGSSRLDLFKTPPMGLHFEQTARELKLYDVIEQYAALMGWRLLVGQETRDDLRNLPCSLALPLDIRAENVHSFVEGVAASNDLVFSFAKTKEPVFLQVQSLNVSRVRSARAEAQLIPPSDLRAWSAHPAFLVTTLVALPGLDVATISNSVRQMFGGQETQQILPLAPDGLLVMGFGDKVASLSTLFLALARLPTAPVTASATPPPGEEMLRLLAPPAQALHLEFPGRSDCRLIDLLEAYTQRMGWRLLLATDTRNQLRTLPLGLALPLDVAPENVHSFVEGVLKTNSFVMRFAHTQEPVLLSVESTNVAGRGSARESAMPVPAADLPRWAAHSDFMITTCLDLPGIDVRTLSNSLRQMFSDQQTEQIIPVGNSNSLILTGFASTVSDFASMFAALVGAEGGTHPAPSAFVFPKSGIELFVTPAKGLHLVRPEGRELKLSEVLRQYADGMGWTLLVEPELRPVLASLNCGFTLPLDIPAENVHSFVEGVACANDLVLGFAHMSDPVLLQVQSTGVAARGNPRKDAAVVRAEELPRWAVHPAFLVTAFVDLQGADVRTLSNSLRQMFFDQQTQQIIPVGDTNGLMVTGHGSEVASLVASLAELVRGGAGVAAAPARPAPSAERARLFPLGSNSLVLDAPAGKDLGAVGVLEAFSKWTQRPIQISESARARMEKVPRAFGVPQIIPGHFAYMHVGLLLEGLGCTLSPVPAAAPETWVVDLATPPKEALLADVPTIPFEELGAWSAYAATPCRSSVQLSVETDSKQLHDVLRRLVDQGLGIRLSERSLLLYGTPGQIRVMADRVLLACAPPTVSPR